MDIQIQVNDQPVRAYLALPAGGKGPGVLVLHAWWGLNPFFKEVCDRLAQAGFVALAPDLFGKPVAHTVEEAQALAQGADQDRIAQIVGAATETLWTHQARSADKLGVLGFSFGAAWALLASAEIMPERFGAAAVYYGVFLNDFSRMRARFLGNFSDVDPWEPLEGIQALEAGLREAGVDATVHFYPGLPHWFSESDRPEYNPAAAELAWSRTIAFFRESL